MAQAKNPSALSKLNAAGKILIGGAMLAIPAIGYFVVFHSEIEAEIEAEQKKQVKLDGELKEAQAAERAYQKDLQELREKELNRGELLKVLPATTEYPAFLSSVQNVANLVGVELQAWTPMEEVPEEFYARVPMQLELVGRFHQLARFFYNVGRLERIINMENISLDSPQVVDSEIRLRAKVLATAFHAVDETSAADAPESRRRRDRKN